MTLQAKLKQCSFCGKMTRLWKSAPPTCKDCHIRVVHAEADGHAPVRKVTLKTKPKPRVNGKPLHTALYMAAFGYGDKDFIPSELSGDPAVDVHHISCRGLGGTRNADRIENLMALTREEHMEYGDKKQYMAFLYQRHMDFMLASGVRFDREWMLDMIEKHSER
jgi:hypothetical protein